MLVLLSPAIMQQLTQSAARSCSLIYIVDFFIPDFITPIIAIGIPKYCNTAVELSPLHGNKASIYIRVNIVLFLAELFHLEEDVDLMLVCCHTDSHQHGI